MTPVSQLAVAYLRHYATRAETDFWAFNEVCDRVASGDSAEDAWQVTLALVAAADQESLGYVGAGPLEDFVRRWGSDYLTVIETLASQDPKFRACLGCVWLDRFTFAQDIMGRLVSASGGQMRLLGERAT